MEDCLRMSSEIYLAMESEKNDVIFISLFSPVYFIQSLHCIILEIILTIFEKTKKLFHSSLKEGF